MSLLIITNSLKNSQDIIRNQTNKPELRQKLILDHLKDKHTILISQKNPLSINDLFGIHTQNFLLFLENAYQSWIDNGKDMDYVHSENGGLIPYHYHRRKEFQSHISLPYWKQIGYYCDGFSTPIHQDSFQIALDSTYNGFQAVNKIDQYQAIYCLNTYPGHHAFSDGYGGYCFLNNIALIADQLIQKRRATRVAILDVDYHHGNGTQDIFYHRKDVLTVSIHADPKFEYPSYSGFESEKGINNINFPLSQGTTWNQYQNTLDKALAKIKEYNPEYLLIAFGGDTLEEDPDVSVLGGFRLEIKDYYQMGVMISSLKKKMIVAQEGGYQMEKMPYVLENFLEGILNYNH